MNSNEGLAAVFTGGIDTISQAVTSLTTVTGFERALGNCRKLAAGIRVDE
jgi:hypothetical protein